MSEQSRKYSYTAGIKNEHNFRVRIPFIKNMVDLSDVRATINNWDECSIKAIEMFGLPGDKYTCRFTEQAIEFWFLEEKDAMIFELTCG